MQYLCQAYVELPIEHQFAISDFAKGNPYHNAFVESFMKTLKQEEVYLANYETYLDVLENLAPLHRGGVQRKTRAFGDRLSHPQ